MRVLLLLGRQRTPHVSGIHLSSGAQNGTPTLIRGSNLSSCSRARRCRLRSSTPPRRPARQARRCREVGVGDRPAEEVVGRPHATIEQRVVGLRAPDHERDAAAGARPGLPRHDARRVARVHQAAAGHRVEARVGERQPSMSACSQRTFARPSRATCRQCRHHRHADVGCRHPTLGADHRSPLGDGWLAGTACQIEQRRPAAAGRGQQGLVDLVLLLGELVRPLGPIRAASS